MATTTGHFNIADLSFSFEADLKEIAHCQEIIREIREAEYDLQSVSGAEKVYLVYNRDLEGERGTFDKMRLRAYDGEKSYTIDLGVTDTNPLGIFVAHDAEIDVYHYDREERWSLDRDGNRVRDSSNGASTGAREEASSDRPSSPSSSSEGSSNPDTPSAPQASEEEGGLITTADDTALVREAKLQTEEKGNASKPIGTERGKIIWNCMKRNDLTKHDLKKVCEEYEVDSIKDLPFASVKEAYGLIQNLIEFSDTDLPF